MITNTSVAYGNRGNRACARIGAATPIAVPPHTVATVTLRAAQDSILV